MILLRAFYAEACAGRSTVSVLWAEADLIQNSLHERPLRIIPREGASVF